MRQVWIEVRLQQALSLQRQDIAMLRFSCGNLGAEVPEFAFTRDGLTPLLDSARTQYFLGMLYSSVRPF